MRQIVLLGLIAASAGLCSACAEELDLTKVKTVDWSKEALGGIKTQQAMLAPTMDPKELAGLMQRGNGVKLSSEDDAHAVVVALGPVGTGTSYALTQTYIDRFRHLIEITFEITKPSPGATEAKAALEAKKPQQEEIVIASTKAPPPRLVPQSLDGYATGNTAFFLPAGKLEFGTWYLRVKTFMKDGDKRSEAPAITDTFVVKDDRPILKGEKGKKTPTIGMDVPNSPSVTDGMGGR